MFTDSEVLGKLTGAQVTGEAHEAHWDVGLDASQSLEPVDETLCRPDGGQLQDGTEVVVHLARRQEDSATCAYGVL